MTDLLTLTDPCSPALNDQYSLKEWLNTRYDIEDFLQQWANKRPIPSFTINAFPYWVDLWRIYEMVQTASTTPIPLSPRAQRFEAAFAEAAASIAGSGQQLPESAMLHHCLLQWYQSLDTPEYCVEHQKEMRRPRENLKRFEYWLEQLRVQYSRFCLVRVDLGYAEGVHPPLHSIQAHRNTLCKAMHQNSLFQALLGYAWTLEWKPQKGFHYHFVFCFNGHRTCQDITLGTAIGEYWRQIAQQYSGVYFNCNTRHYPEKALGELRYHDLHKRDMVIEKIGGYLAKQDAIAALVVQRTFQTSVIKKPLPTSVGRPRQYDV